MNSVSTFSQPMEPVTPVGKEDFRQAMARLGAAVNVVTTDGPSGRAGFAATAVCSVSDTPPMLLVCLNRSASVFDAVVRNGALCVNVLASHHDTLSNLFGGKTSVDERFAAGNWQRTASGAYALEDALASFDCLVSDSKDVASHRVLFCSVLDVRQGADCKALIYQNRGYHKIGSDQP